MRECVALIVACCACVRAAVAVVFVRGFAGWIGSWCWISLVVVGSGG